MYGVYVGKTAVVCSGDKVESTSPINGSVIASFNSAQPNDVIAAIDAAHQAFILWRTVPAPKRGELVRRLGDTFRERKDALAAAITLEVGKTMQEALGEVQEVIDVCEFAVGLSRQLHGLTIASERHQHRLSEQWHPLGVVGIITAFNFPMAVWAWNAAIALVCGDALVWKPSEKAPMCAKLCHDALMDAASQCSFEVPLELSVIVNGDRSVGQVLAASSKVPLISATGSVSMGRAVATTVAERLGRTLLELGGNNAMIVAPTADVDLAVQAAVFSAVGTSGQRCTTLRRAFVHESVYGEFTSKLSKAYEQITVGDPRNPDVQVGPVIDSSALVALGDAMKEALELEGCLLCIAPSVVVPPGGTYAFPVVFEMPKHYPIVDKETFAPILYVLKYTDINHAIALNNRVSQGLSSTIMTNDLREAELFCSAVGSDCGIANVNIGTSGAEIGGAFGGEKDTGGGRESGSDSWKSYMRRQTNTINYGSRLPLAQGVRFELPSSDSR